MSWFGGRFVAVCCKRLTVRLIFQKTSKQLLHVS
jgi:hypothetical protein